jgi:hypothetical protein
MSIVSGSWASSTPCLEGGGGETDGASNRVFSVGDLSSARGGGCLETVTLRVRVTGGGGAGGGDEQHIARISQGGVRAPNVRPVSSASVTC